MNIPLKVKITKIMYINKKNPLKAQNNFWHFYEKKL